MRKWLLILGCLVIVGGGAVYYFMRSPGKENAASAALARSVQAEQGNMEVKVSGTGSVSAADTSSVKAGYQGTIEKVLVVEGEQVKKGQVLAQFEKTDNSIAVAQKQLDKQKQQLQLQNLKDQYNTESDANKKAQLKLDIDSARLSIQQADSDIANLQTQAESHTITASISGTVTALSISPGDNVNAGMEAAVLTDYSQLTFVINADELDVPKLKSGQSANITLNALTGQAFTGKITSIAQVGVSSNGVATYPVTLSISNPSGILAGMSGSAEVVTQSVSNAVLVPIDAVVTVAGKSFVRVPEGTEGAVSLGTQGMGDSGAESGSAAAGSPSGAGAAGRGSEGGRGYQDGRSGAAGQPGAATTAGSKGQGTDSARMNRMTLGGQLKEVTTGLTNDTYVEIKSGLAAGDTVLIALPTGTTGGSTGQSSSGASQFGGMGMGGAGMGVGGAGFGGGIRSTGVGGGTK